MTHLVMCTLWDGQHGPGAQKTTCIYCPRELAVSPQGGNFLANHPDFAPVCALCMRAYHGEQFLLPLPGTPLPSSLKLSTVILRRIPIGLISPDLLP